MRIKAGDISGYVSKDGDRYGSDTYFSGGAAGGINAPDAPVSRADQPWPRTISGSTTDFREGAFSYRIPVSRGRYRVTLKFQEPAVGTAGAREFDVLANGKVMLGRFDIFAAAGGKLKGVDRVFDADSRDGEILIEFRPLRGRALVSALSITPLDRH